MRLAVACTHTHTHKRAALVSHTGFSSGEGRSVAQAPGFQTHRPLGTHRPRPPSRCSPRLPRPESIAADSPFFLFASMRCRREQSSTLSGARTPLHRGGGWLESSKDEVFIWEQRIDELSNLPRRLRSQIWGWTNLGLASAWLFL